MECIDCDFEKLDENDCCPHCEKTLCSYCEDHMYDTDLLICTEEQHEQLFLNYFLLKKVFIALN